MNKPVYLWLATGAGLVFLLVLAAGGAFRPDEQPRLPLLGMLLMAEFGAIANALAAFFALRAWARDRRATGLLMTGAAAAVVAVALLFSGVLIWQGFIASA